MHVIKHLFSVTLNFPLHLSEISFGVDLRDSLAQDHCAVCDSGQKQVPQEEFSSRITIQSHLSGVTSRLPAMYVSRLPE